MLRRTTNSGTTDYVVRVRVKGSTRTDDQSFPTKEQATRVFEAYKRSPVAYVALFRISSLGDERVLLEKWGQP
jgi:hypothetical protein